MLLKRKENKMDMKKSLLLVIGSLLIFISIFLFSFNYYNSYKDDIKEQKNLDYFYEKQENFDCGSCTDRCGGGHGRRLVRHPA